MTQPTNEEIKKETTARLAALLMIPISLGLARVVGPTVSPVIADQLSGPLAGWIVDGAMVLGTAAAGWYYKYRHVSGAATPTNGGETK